MALTYDYVVRVIVNLDVIDVEKCDTLLEAKAIRQRWMEDFMDEGYTVKTVKFVDLDVVYAHPDDGMPDVRIWLGSERKVR